MNLSSFDHSLPLLEPLPVAVARRAVLCALFAASSLSAGCIHRQQGTASAEPAKSVEVQSESREAVPVVELVHNFGIVPVNAAQTHQFKIKNPAKSLWQVAEVRSDCACTVAKPSSLIIEPGGQITVPVTLKGAAESRDVDRKVVLRLAQREAPQIILRIKAKVREALALYPKALHFDVYGVEADQRSYAMVDNFGSNAWSGLRLSSVPDWLGIRQEPVSQSLDCGAGEQSSAPRQRWRLVVFPNRSLLQRLPFGIHETQITVSALNANAPGSSTMFVRLHRHRLLEVVPSDLFFGEVAPGERKSMSALILDRRPTDAPLARPSVQKPSDPRLECNLESHVGSAWRFRVTFRADQLEGYASSDVKMSFGANDNLHVILPCRVNVVKRRQG